MRSLRFVLPLVVAGLAALAAPADAGESPYLEPILTSLERFKMAHASELAPKALARLDAMIAALSSPGGEFVTHLRALQRLSRLAAKAGASAPRGLIGDALDGMAAEIGGNLERLRDMNDAASQTGKNVTKLQRKARRLLDAVQAALDAADAGVALPARAQQLFRAYQRLTAAFAVIGKIDSNVVLTWTYADSIGPLGTPYVTGVNARVVPVDGQPRRFLVYVPATVTIGTPAAVVVMHHGSSGTGEQFLNISGWREKADEVGLIAVFPTALTYLVLDSGRISTKWNDWSLPDEVDLSVKPDGYPEASPWPADDVAFEGRILDELESSGLADANRLYASGFSNGAAFTARLAVEMSDRYEAVGCCSGGLFDSVRPPAARIPVAMMFGTADDRFLDALNHPADGSPEPDPQFTEIPLDPAVLLANPQIDPRIRNFLTSFDLAHDPHGETLDATSTLLHWATPLAGNADGNAYDVRVLAGLIHHYPHGDVSQRNPNGFSAPGIFWAFFEP